MKFHFKSHTQHPESGEAFADQTNACPTRGSTRNTSGKVTSITRLSVHSILNFIHHKMLVTAVYQPTETVTPIANYSTSASRRVKRAMRWNLNENTRTEWMLT